MIFFYWLYIEPYVSISIKNGNILLYNCLNGKRLEYSNNSLISNLVKRLKSKNNLLVVKLTKNDIINIEISDFIKKLRKYYIGDIIKSSYSINKPIQLKPILNVQKSVDILKRSPNLNVGRKMMMYLKDLTIFINGACSLNCSNCKDSYKQFSFCTKFENALNELNIIQIKKIIDDFKGTSLQKINITGGNIFNYSKFNELNKLLINYSTLLEYRVHYKNIFANIDKINNLNKGSSLNILVDTEINIKILKEVKELVNKKNVNAKFCFIVSSIDDFNKIEKNISKINITDYIIHPYYNKSNLSLFKNNVFITKQDIFEAKPTQNDIFVRQVLNPINFGKLFVKCNGNIYSNLNNPILGNINNVSIYDSVYKEMDKGKSWWKLRTNIKPCNNCLYNLLCPPISNYEYVIGKYNLCNIKKAL